MAASLMPRFAEALSNVGTSLKERAQHEEAARMFESAIDAKPTLCEAYKNLGSSYAEISGRLPEATLAFEGALRINPQFWPAMYSLLDTKQFLCDWRGRHGLLRKLTAHLEDLHTRQQLGAGPDERMHGGLAPFQTLVMPLATSTQLAVTHNRAQKDIALAASTPLEPPLRWTADQQRSAASSGSTAQCGAWKADATPARRRLCDLRLGLISSDFGDHPVGHALLPWIRVLQSRQGLHVVCIASDSAERPHSGTALRRSIASECGVFVDVTTLTDMEAARVINEQQLHVVLNLVGHTAGSRHVVTQYKPAPVQGMHYGYPATTALPAMGYMLVDRVAVPPSLKADFTEKLAYFPFCHFVAVHAARYAHVPATSRGAHPCYVTYRGMRRVGGDSSGDLERDTCAKRLVPVSEEEGGGVATRGDLGLGRVGSQDGVFAICNFNQLYKMEPETFETWANALRRLPNGFLWLTRVSVRKDTSLYAEANLRAEAHALGILHQRIGFSFRFPEKEHVAFRALADLMVDNRAYNAHTTGADTLWAGVPAVIPAGRHLAGRAGAAFANALGAAEMTVTSMRAYEDKIHQLGTRPHLLMRQRERLLHMRERAPFFDLPRLAEGQHRIAAAMWNVFAAGQQPMHVMAAR